MRTKLSLALSAVLAAFLFAGAATAAPGHSSTIHQLIPEAGVQGDLVTNVKFQFPKTKKPGKFQFPKKKKPGKFAFPKKKKPGKFQFPKKKKPGKFQFPNKKGENGVVKLPIHPCLLNPSKCNGGGDNGHNHHGHNHGFPGLHVGLGFAYNVTEVAPTAAYPVACVVPPATATQPTLLDHVVARLVQLKELDRQGLIEDDEYEAQKTVVLVALVPVTVAQEVGVAYGLQVLKCIEEQDLISENEYDAKRKEFVAIL